MIRTRLQIVVPMKLQRKVLEIFHDLNGHPGTMRTRHTLRQFYFWPGYRGDIENYVGTCQVCQLRKQHYNRAMVPTVLYETGDTPLERVHMDLSGPHLKSKQMEYILVIKDYLTKWTVLYAIEDKEAETVAKRFVNYVSHYGTPRSRQRI